MYKLTPMQAACWFGRMHSSDSQKKQASAHLYVEFDGELINISKLQLALEQLYIRHDLLRLGLTIDGIPYISNIEKPLLEIEDLRELTFEKQQQALLTKRQIWTHQQLDVKHAEVVKFSISLLTHNRFRLHIDTDMIAIDPSSLRILLEDLAIFYRTPEKELPKISNFFDWFNGLNKNIDFRNHMTIDKAWWQSKLDSITPAPTLPVSSDNLITPKSKRLFTYLSPTLLNQLSEIAKTQSITLTNLFLTLFTVSLNNFTNDKEFRLSIPTFWRQPSIDNIQHIIGDFANFVIGDFKIDRDNSLYSLSQQISKQMIERLAHSHYAGVNIMRDLSRHKQSIQLNPIVFTSAIDLPEGNLYSKNVKDVFGSMVWSVSEAPETALDVQLVRDEDKLLINWDVRLDKIPLDWVTYLFNYFIELVIQVANNSNLIEYKISDILTLVTSKPLNALQRSYLLGRTNQLPLGGVAMQEYRKYEGKIDVALLKNRLTQIIKQHDSLRTYINPHTLIQITYQFIESAFKESNLTEIHLEDLSVSEADVYVATYIQNYKQALLDLTYSPWNISIFYLPQEKLTIIAKFDALILDGRAISKLFIELFTNHQDSAIDEVTTITEIQPTDRPLQKTAKNYWINKLSDFRPPVLPYIADLQEVKQSIFERESLCIPKTVITSLFHLASKQGLFKNSIILALILDSVSKLANQPIVYAAVPVLPTYTGKLSNNSTFIVVGWQVKQACLFNQAQILQTDILEGLDNLHFSGVDLARYLVNKTTSIPVLPLVITNGLSWESLPAEHSMKFKNGLTQTPQIVLDIRFSFSATEELVFDIDYVRNAISSLNIKKILNGLHSGILDLTDN